MHWRTLRIESEDGAPVNEYRVRYGQVEFRILDFTGRPLTRWHLLSDEEIQLHQNLHTVVADWLVARKAA